MSTQFPPAPSAMGPGQPFMSGGNGSGPAAPSGKRGRKDKDKTAKTPKRKLLGLSRNVVILTLVAATALAWLGLSSAGAASVYVVRTSSAVPALATVDGRLEAVQLPESAVEQGAFTAATAEEALAAATTELQGKKTQYPLLPGQQVHREAFSTDAALPVPLGKDERLFSVRAHVAAAIAGGLRPGDRVDVIGVVGNGGDAVAGVVASNVEIVSVAPSEQVIEAAQTKQGSPEGKKQDANQLLPDKPLGGTYVVRVDSATALKLAVADEKSDRLYLAYRSADATDAASQQVTLADSVCALDPTACPTN